uniref:Uncharacterized protein n=1 Tax=Guillardia theta TaxID=55529 RepID=A0A7S4JVD6_GUITH|mmetsp:Transcript_18942/g.62263  ORF Transcript_18942/g.62263 Transcript_18942/m.62263 type:complete len:119 (+) Transcript_18942:535-891(+)
MAKGSRCGPTEILTRYCLLILSGSLKFVCLRRVTGLMDFSTGKEHSRRDIHRLVPGNTLIRWGENSGMNASNVYTGDWKEGVREGRGTLTWANGSTYTGSWKNDHRHGEKRVQEVRIV